MKLMEKCIFEDKKCPVIERLEKVNPVCLALFCQSCTATEIEKRAVKEFEKMVEQMKIAKAHLIISLLQLFPKDEDKAKEHYQALMKRVEEWGLKEASINAEKSAVKRG